MEVAKVHPATGIHHIHGRVKQNHAATHRASHVSPNVAQVPKVGSPYGAECRELWHVPVGWVQIGADASGLELRCLAHYMGRWDGGAYGREVIGGDIHTVNQKAAGLATRNEAKTFIYAWLYGEGDEARGAKFLPKTATSAQKRRKGKKVSEDFLKGLPALAKLKAMVTSKLTQNGGPGYMLLPDQRRVYIRQEHSALNYLLQGAGAIICKRWIVTFNRKLIAEFGQQGWTGKWAALGWIHDEVQLAVRPEIATRVQEILVESIRHMTQHFNWRCPLDGEAKVGANWKDCH
jgi:DNA polymerase I-like protein with 3'-5' exonuclease and polymerase domains